MELVQNVFAVVDLDVFDGVIVGSMEVETILRRVEVMVDPCVQFLDVVVAFWQLNCIERRLAIRDGGGGEQ